MRSPRFLLLAGSALAVAILAQDKQNQYRPSRLDEGFAQVHMGISCGPPVAAEFDRALAFLHNFWYARAGKRFNQVLKNDSECAMAYCGAALSYNHPFWDPPSQADEASAWALVQRGISGSEVPDAKNSTSQRWPPGTEMPGPEAKQFATRITATRWRLPTPNIRTMKPLCFLDCHHAPTKSKC